MGLTLQRFLDSFGVLTNCFLPSRLDLGNDRKAVAGRCPGKHRTILSLSPFEISLLRYGLRLRPERVFLICNHLLSNRLADLVEVVHSAVWLDSIPSCR